MSERDRHLPPEPERAVPQGMVVAASELVLSLAQMTRSHTGEVSDNLYTRDRKAITHMLRALTGLFQLEGGRISVKWLDTRLSVNDLRLPPSDKLKIASQKLRQRLGSKGVAGIIFRLVPDTEQTRQFFRQLASMEAHDVHQFGREGEVVNLIGTLDHSGIQLLLGIPGQNYDSQPGYLSGISARTSFEDVVEEHNMSWIGTTDPEDDPRRGQVDEGSTQRFCLGTYVNLVTTSLRLVRVSPAIQSGRMAMPTLPLNRCVEQIAHSMRASAGLMQACMLLGARDLSPSRRMAHTVMTSVGLAVARGQPPRAVAEVGLAAFAYGLRARFRQLARQEERHEWEILKLLAHEQVLTSLKVRAIHAAALVGSQKPDLVGTGSAPIEIPSVSRVVHLCADFAGHLDGTMNGKLIHAPLPAAVVLQDLSQRIASQRERVSYSEPHLLELACWLSPTPPGTLVRLKDRRTAVIVPSEPNRIVALPLLESNLMPIAQPATRVTIGSTLSNARWPTDLKIIGITSARPLVHLAAQSLFYHARDLWRGII